ncbi:TPA: EexN family lipoprotein [Stenotrophomonas maltophilia]|nr:EexN family lipoprotein [Stenotrophomonas maltophilia]
MSITSPRAASKAAMLCSVIFILNGCSAGPKTEKWYSSNLKAAEEKVRWCLKPEQRQLAQEPEHSDAQECKNAHAALREATFRKMTGQ